MPAPYAFDPTGIAPANLVTGETHVLTAMNFQDYHFVVPTYAPFFETGLVISHTGLDNVVRTLDAGVDYFVSHWFIGASRGTALPVYGSITFLDLELAGTVTLAYRTLGGEWNIDEPQIAEILGDRIHNPRITAWEQVSGSPTVFPVIDHVWNLDDLVGLAEILPKLDGIEQAIIDRTLTGLDAHLAAFNPHGITPALIGTYTSAQIIALINGSTGASGLVAHSENQEAHPQYAKRTDIEQELYFLSQS